MKKIIFFFVLSFIFIFNVDATSFYLGERIEGVFIRMIQGERVSLDVTKVIRRDDGEFVYCVDPFIYAKFYQTYNEYDYNNNSFNLTDEQLDKVNVLSYFGYGYKDHTDLKWYAITQVAIWRAIGADDAYFMDSRDGNRISIYDNELNELQELAYNYYTLPSFSNNGFKYTINQVYEIIDLNNVLDSYEVKSSNIDYERINNKLYINTKEVGNYEIGFIKKSPIDRNYLLYSLDNSQPLIYPGRINDIEFKINIEVVDGSITINKNDSEDKKREFATLRGAIYGIYDEDNLVREIETDINGVAYVGNLPLGKYIIKELVASVGYNLDENIYEIELTPDDRDVTIQSVENIIKGDINLNKYYGDKNNYELENGAIFDIYDVNDNLVGSYETNNGKINEKLDYGDYYVIQKKGIDGYSFIDKFSISINENKEYNFNLYDNILIVDVPNTGIKKNKINICSIILILSGIVLILKKEKTTK